MKFKLGLRLDTKNGACYYSSNLRYIEGKKIRDYTKEEQLGKLHLKLIKEGKFTSPPALFFYDFGNLEDQSRF